jgi:hypothetical protein
MAGITIDDALYTQLATEYLSPSNRTYFDSHFQ